MSVFDRLAAREAATVPTLATRRAGRFEPGPGQGLPARGEPQAGPDGSPLTTARVPDDGTDASAAPPAASDAGAGTAPGRPRTPPGPVPRPAAPRGSSPDTTTPDTGRGPHRGGTPGATEPAATGESPADGLTAPATPDPSRARTTRRSGPPERRGPRTNPRTNPRAATTRPDQRRGGPLPGAALPGDALPGDRPRGGSPAAGVPRNVTATDDQPRAVPASRTRPGTPPSDRTGDAQARPLPGPLGPATLHTDGGETGARRPPAGPGTNRPPELATRTLTRDDLLARLAPALAADGILSRREAERIVAVPTRVTDRRRASGGTGDPGDAESLPADRPAAGLDPLDVPDRGDVHVHIGRIDVHRPDPGPAPERSERRQPSRVDHSTYLARQEGRWRR